MYINELKFDEALITVSNHLPEPITLQYVSDYCYQCLPESFLMVPMGTSNQGGNASAVISTRFIIKFQVLRGAESLDFVCGWERLYEEHGHYMVTVTSSESVLCQERVIGSITNCYLPLLVAFVTLLGISGLYLLSKVTLRLHCTQRFLKDCCKKMSCLCKNSELTQNNCGEESNIPKRKRLLSLDTFRGFALTLMVFVNYGGGGYWFFEHAPWNGLTVADLVMPWFVFIIGTSVALAFSSMLKRGVNRCQLLRKLIWRTLVLILIGIFLFGYDPAYGPFSWSSVRIPGVLQRLGFTYFFVAVMHTFFCHQNTELAEGHVWSSAVRDLVTYWPEWIIIISLETMWLCLTFLLPVPGCPTGYLGAGGIGDYGRYPNCTGGAAGYIDQWFLGGNHMYHYPTCKELYKTTQPFDPEGILGTINSVVMAFFGLQAGKIILIYRKTPLSILKRFLVWSVILGVISAILTKCTRDEGFIPINKNLWSLSYVTTLSCFSFLLLGLMFYVIDVKGWWRGQPFIYPGLNSIFVYIGHSLLASYFPFKWQMKDMNTHYEVVAQDVLGTAIWVLVSYLLYRKKFFLKI
ncbi:heparan-alpha-glucosaminide N-acetyltransferase-like [Bombina bombina]|uniref:heparan-alpha-glucosaminide N-acetyltransferase-like n=1 Tax=Bombina bombina TaxID=8345 RepID=UPI00235AD2BE|nr:heparan-alpha-glucosaminide N-acetyltransferase-like [Bombina bombina]